MANSDAPFGAVPIGTTDGSDYHGKLREVEFLDTYATAVYLGDFVKLTGNTSADGKTPVVEQAAAGNAVIGAIVSFVPDFTDESSLSNASNYKPASKSRKAMVAFGSDVLYEMQESGALATTDQARNVDVTVAAGSSITGISAMEIDSASVADADGQLRLHRLSRKEDNELGTNAIWVVSINENQDDHGAGVS